MNECGFRIYRGMWFIGPCRALAGHEGRHDPLTPREHIVRMAPAIAGYPKPVVAA